MREKAEPAPNRRAKRVLQPACPRQTELVNTCSELLALTALSIPLASAAFCVPMNWDLPLRQQPSQFVKFLCSAALGGLIVHTIVSEVLWFQLSQQQAKH